MKNDIIEVMAIFTFTNFKLFFGYRVFVYDLYDKDTKDGRDGFVQQTRTYEKSF